MNQILVTNFNNKFNNKKGKEDKKIFKVQFIISITIIVFAICFFIYYLYSLKTSENFSKKIISNYNISTLYSSNKKNNEIQSSAENSIFGIIEIPKINIYYPVFSFLSEENLKVSPCKLYGTNLNENTNICIAGHNYNNDMFFSNIDKLQNGTYTTHQILTLASIVELEAVSDSDRALVAGVLYNRLNDNWSLGCDATTYYAAKKSMTERLTQSDLTACNGYNTRCTSMTGLPVGPIDNPSISSIKAALNPTESDYYYFVADTDKKVYFTKNATEHDRIISKLRDEGKWAA